MEKYSLKFYRSEDGAPRAQAREEDGHVLAAFLESDLQDDAVMVRELLERLSRPLDADDQIDAFVGNAFAVTVDGDTVTLAGHAEGNDITSMIALTDLQHALQKWLKFVAE